MDLVRPTGNNPAFQIVDGILDLRGNPIETIGTGGIKARTDYDAQRRPIKRYQAFGTTDVVSTETEYNDLGRVEASIATDGLRTEQYYDPAGNVIENRIVSPAFGNQSTKYTYTLKGRQKSVVANDNSVTENFYNTCCGRLAGTRNALNNGTIVNADANGRTVHNATVEDFDTQILSNLNPDTAKTFSESTTRYGNDGQVAFTTRWSVDPGPIDVNNPPIAGLDGVSSASGLTTQYVHARYLKSNTPVSTAGRTNNPAPSHRGS